MMELYILRHGIATDQEGMYVGNDRERPLTPKGMKKMKKECRGMRALQLEFDLILTSPLVRARQTAEVVAKAFDAQDKLEDCAHLASGGDHDLLVKQLQSYPEDYRILLVGHEPDLGTFIASIAFGNEHASLKLRKGGLCKVVLDNENQAFRGTLEWLLTPKQLLMLG
ncbi:MAG: phosphohistidine phosphatase SixA [Bacteroidota bacterium]